MINFDFSEKSSKFNIVRQSSMMYLRFAQAIWEVRPDIVHANDIRTARAMLPIAKLFRIPFLYTMRDTKRPGSQYGRTWRRVCRFADQVITLSEEMSKFAIDEFGARPERLESINSIVDLSEFAPISIDRQQHNRTSLGLSANEVAIGIVGVVSEKKGQLRFIENSWPRIRAQVSGARLHIIGDHRPDIDPYCAAVQAVAERAGAVEFYGLTSRVPEWLQALDLVVVSSQNEGLARCMIESLACGTPVISFDVCSAHEMLTDSGGGVVVPLDDYQSLASSVIDVALDRNRAVEMGVSGRSLAEAKFNRDVVEDRWRRVYNRVTTGVER